ncbi:hypothetical protein D9M72_330450 [compost metagenome]
MDSTLLTPVGAAAAEEDGKRRCHIRNGRIPTEGLCAGDTGGFDDCRQPEAQGVDRRDDAQIGYRQEIHLGITQYHEKRFVPPVCSRVRFRGQRAFLRVVEPFRIGRIIDEQEVGCDAKHEGGGTFNEKHPLPTGEAGRTGESRHDPRRQRPSNNSAERARKPNHRNCAGDAVRTIPARQVEEDARREAGFEDAQQKAQGVEHRDAIDEHHAHRGDTPEHHDAAEGKPGANPGQQEIAWHLEQDIAHEKYSCPDAVGGVGEAEIALHLKLRKAYVDSVQISEHEANEQQWQQAYIYFSIEGRTVRPAP